MDTHVSPTVESANSTPHAIRWLALNRIEPSGTPVQQRRRSHYDAAALKELAANIKAVHVIEPIVVRPKADAPEERFELVAGERRWLASGEAGLESIPAIVRTLDDRQVLEIQLIENLHREGLHPLEEAEGYEALMRDHRYGPDELVANLGRSRAYIYGRLKLLALEKPARKAFYEGKLSTATALLLARIPVQALQLEALKEITAGYNGEPLSFRQAQRHIQDRYMTLLKEAPFDVKAEDLVEGAGPCAICPKRTGNQPELFADIKGGDVCTDPVCYRAKCTAWGARLEASAKAEGRTFLAGALAKRIAPYGTRGSFNEGYVALDATCYADAKHRTYRQLLGKGFKAATLLQDEESGRVVELIQPAEHGETLKAKGINAPKPLAKSPGGDPQRERQKAAKLETHFHERLLDQVRAKSPSTIAGADLHLVATALWRMAGHDARLRLVKLWGWGAKGKAHDAVFAGRARIDKLSEAELRRFVIDCALIDEVRVNPYDTRKSTTLVEIAKRLKIDVAAIRAQLKPDRAPKTQARSSTGTKRKVATANRK